MSVILYSPDEIAEVYRQYEAILPTVRSYAPEKEKMLGALQALHYANTMAYCLTYGDWATDELGKFYDLEPFVQAAPLGWNGKLMWSPGAEYMLKVAHRLRGFLYNAISNGGTDCLPEKYHEIIRYACECITDHVSGYDKVNPWAA